MYDENHRLSKTRTWREMGLTWKQMSTQEIVHTVKGDKNRFRNSKTQASNSTTQVFCY